MQPNHPKGDLSFLVQGLLWESLVYSFCGDHYQPKWNNLYVLSVTYTLYYQNRHSEAVELHTGCSTFTNLSFMSFHFCFMLSLPLSFAFCLFNLKIQKIETHGDLQQMEKTAQLCLHPWHLFPVIGDTIHYYRTLAIIHQPVLINVVIN